MIKLHHKNTRYEQELCLENKQLNIPSFIPPNCLKPPGLQGCHYDIYIIVPISQHAFLVRRHQGAGRKPAHSTESLRDNILYAHVTLWCSLYAGSPLVYLLQGVPTKGRPILEDVIERVQGTQLPPLLLMINRWRCQRGLERCWRCKGGRGG